MAEPSRGSGRRSPMGRWMGDGKPPQGYQDDDALDLGPDSYREVPGEGGRAPPLGGWGGPGDEGDPNDRWGKGRGGRGARGDGGRDRRWRDGGQDGDGPTESREKIVGRLESIVRRHFSIYHVEFDRKSAVFYYNRPMDLDGAFEDMRGELREEGFIPFLRTSRGERIIQVMRRPESKPTSVWVNLMMFGFTIFTTVWAGSVLWSARTDVQLTGYMDYFGILKDPALVGNGALFFALPLMLILGIHEMGHYYAARRHGVDASLPFFIPVPPPFFIGTMGAFISMREPIPDKKALMNIGAAGPIAGFVVAIPVTMAGMWLTGAQPVSIEGQTGDFIVFNAPIIYGALGALIPAGDGLAIHPMAIAGWVGIFITGLNLLPAGQLDGGHIARALLGEKAVFASAATVGVLMVLGFVTGFIMWFIFGLFILFLTGVRHPPPLNDISRLGTKHYAIGVAAIAIFALSIHYMPLELMVVEAPEADFDLTADEIEGSVGPFESGTAEYVLVLANLGEETDSFRIRMGPASDAADAGPVADGTSPGGWTAVLEIYAMRGGETASDGGDGRGTGSMDPVDAARMERPQGEPDRTLEYSTDNLTGAPGGVDVELGPDGEAVMYLNVTSPDGLPLGENHTVEVKAASELMEKYNSADEGGGAAVRRLSIRTGVSSIDVSPDRAAQSIGRGARAHFPITVRNTMDVPNPVNISLKAEWDGGRWDYELTGGGTATINASVGDTASVVPAGGSVELVLEAWFEPALAPNGGSGGAVDPFLADLGVTSGDGSAQTSELIVYPVSG